MAKKSPIQFQEQRAQMLFMNDDFLQDVKGLRHEIGIEEGGFSDDEKYQEWLESEGSKGYQTKIETLRNRYCFAELYQSVIRNFVVRGKYNRLLILGSNVEVKLQPFVNYPFDHPSISVEVFPETTKEDYEAAWNDVKLLQKWAQSRRHLPGNQKAKEEFDLYKRIYQLKKQGDLSNKAIFEKLKDEAYALSEAFGYQTVGVYYQRFKKAIEALSPQSKKDTTDK